MNEKREVKKKPWFLSGQNQIKKRSNKKGDSKKRRIKRNLGSF